MMHSIIAISLCFAGLVAQTNGTQPLAQLGTLRQTAPAAVTVDGDPPARPPAERDIGAVQAVEAALEAFDRLEAGAVEEARVADLEDINEYIAVVQAKDPGNPWLPYVYGRAHALAGRHGDAIDYLQRFVETREGRNEWKAYRILGDLFVEGYPRLAKANYETAAALKADEPSVLYGLSVCAVKIGDNAEAIRLGRRAVEADGGRTLRYLSHLAAASLAEKQWDDAERAAVSAVRVAEKAADGRKGDRAALATVDGQYQLLIEVLWAKLMDTAETEQIVADCLRLAGYLRERGEIAATLSQYEVLRALELGAERTAPETPTKLLEQLAIALAEVGRTETAVAVFEEVLERDPDNPIAPGWLDRLRPQSPTSEQTEQK